MKGHKPSPRPAPNEMLVKHFTIMVRGQDAAVTSRYAAARCAICSEAVHLAGATRRWRHGDEPGYERVAR